MPVDTSGILLATKAASPSAIVKMIRAALEWWSTFVSKTMAIITEPITKVWNGALWSTITKIYNALLPVGYVSELSCHAEEADVHIT